MKFYSSIFDFISAKRREAQDLDLRHIHGHTVTVMSTGLLMWAYAILAFITISSPIPGIVGIICSSIHLLSPLLFRISNNSYMISSIMLGSGFIHQTVFSFFSGGFESHILIWYGILPMLGGIIAGRKSAVLWAILCTISAAFFLFLYTTNYPFPNLITPSGKLLAHAFLVFGWIFLSAFIIYVLLVLNESKERLLTEQGKKIEDLFRVLFHDLAGPLSRISIGLKISMRDDAESSKVNGLEIASKAAASMIEITQNVRRMYAVRQGKLSTDLSYLSLNEAVDYLEKLYATDLEKKNIKIKYDAKRFAGLNVLVEPVSFKNQVLGNLLSNAIKFSGVNSTITIQATSINSDFCEIEISDQGIGMSEDLAKSLFDMSKKTSRVGTAGEQGTGFGMHIVKSFMDLYQGKVQITSCENESENSGTTIKLTLKGNWGQEG